MRVSRSLRFVSIVLALSLVTTAAAFGVDRSNPATEPSAPDASAAAAVEKTDPGAPGLGGSVGAAAADDDFPGVPITASPVRGTLNSSTDVWDVYSIWLNAGDRLSLTLNGDAGTDFDLFLYDINRYQEDGSSRTSYPDAITGYVAPATGSYYVGLKAYSGSGTYTLTWANTPRPAATSCQVNLDLWPTADAGSLVSVNASYQEDWLPIGGKTLFLEQMAYGQNTWNTVGQTTTDANGQGWINHAPATNSYYRIRTDFNGTWVYSDFKTVALSPYLTISSSGSVALSKSFTVSGLLTPKHAAGARDVVIRCYRAGKLRKTVRAKNYSVRAPWGDPITKYKASLKLTSPGKWTLVAVVAGNNAHVAGSASKTVHVNKTRFSARDNGVYATYVRAATLSGKLTNRAGKALGRRTVKVQQSYGGSSWKTVKRLKTNSAGKVSYKVKPKQARYYRLYFPGDKKQASSASSPAWVSSCYAERSGYSSYDDGRWSSSVWLSKGKHRIQAYSREGLGSVYVQDYARTWTKLVNKKSLPSSKWRTYYFKVPRSGWYYLGWRGNWSYSNYIHYKVW